MKKKDKTDEGSGSGRGRTDSDHGGRDRAATESALMAAVGSIVRKGGFAGLGINAVAAKAGVSKVLIYRYFNDLDGLIEAWAYKNNFWGEAASSVLAGAIPVGAERPCGDVHAFAEDFFGGQIASLRASPERREILRWFIAQESPLGSRVMARIEENGRKVTAGIRNLAREDADVEAGLALIASGIYYLALIADRAPVFNGVDLRSEEGWARIERAATGLAAGLSCAAGQSNRQDPA